jgi:ribonucleoside-diphosphate reductase alpha chain
VSKTVNLPQRASLADVREVFDMAHRLKCKGVTVYRYGSRKEQVLYRGEGPAKAADSEYSGGCPTEECWF